MALLATRLEEQVLARQYLRSIDITSRRHPEVAAVKQYQAHDVVADFRLAVRAIAVRRIEAVDLRRGAIVNRLEATGQAHVTGKGVGVLLIDVWLPGFPAEAPEHDLLLCVIPDPVGATVDAGAFPVVRDGAGKDRCLGDCLQ